MKTISVWLVAVAAAVAGLTFPGTVRAQDFNSWKSDLSVMGLMARVGLSSATTVTATIVANRVVGGRRLQDVRLHSSVDTGDILLSISSPSVISNPRPVLFMVGGFQAGRDIVQFFPEAGSNILVGFQYPLDPSLAAPAKISSSPQSASQAADAVMRAIQQAPLQIALAQKWIQAQPWSDRARFSVLGVSLGTLFLPVSLRIAEKIGSPTSRVIFAFGGADFGQMLDREIQERHWMGDQERAAAVNLIRNIMIPYEPQTHLPYLKGSFLVIQGSQDEVFSASVRDAQFSALPQPKDRVVIEGPHINSDKPETITKTIAAIARWLFLQKAIEL